MVICLHQFRYCLDLCVLTFVIEPLGADAGIDFCTDPGITTFQSIMKHSPLYISFLIELAPVGLSYEACFCTDPTEVSSVTPVVPDQNARLKFTSHCKSLLPLIICLGIYISGLVCTAIISCSTLRPIKPGLEDRTVICQKFTELVAEILHICRSAIIGMISVPRREIHTEFQSIFPAGICQFSDHIALSIFPRGVLD